MTEIPMCATCGRKPSERYGVHVLLVRVDFSPAFRGNGCPDPIHDLADQGPAAVALLRDVVFEMAELRLRHRVLAPWTLGERIDALLAATPEALNHKPKETT